MRAGKVIFLCAALALGGCTSMASLVSSVASNLSSSTPTQVNTLADAVQAATLITQAVDVYVKNGNVNRATLLQLQADSNAIHAALVQLQSANAAGQSLVFDTFNASLAAFNSYATAEGISH